MHRHLYGASRASHHPTPATAAATTAALPHRTIISPHATVRTPWKAEGAGGAGMGLGGPGGIPHAPWRARAWRSAVRSAQAFAPRSAVRAAQAFARRPAIGSVLALAALFATGLPAAQAADVGQPLPIAAVPGTTGAPVQLYDGKAKLTYIDFWASWCGPCRQSFPWMNRMQEKYGAQGLRIVAINLDANRNDALAFLKEVPANVSLAFDAKGDSARRVGVKAMPSSVLLGPDGRVLMQHAGFRAEDTAELEARIAAALKAP